MEHPPSQLENVRQSGLKPPSRLPAMSTSNGRTLTETTLSDLNVRSAALGTMAAPNGSIKHKISGLPEPPTKRKTLTERAAEPLNPPRTHAPNTAKLTFARSEGSTLAQVGRPASSHHVNSYRSTSNTSTVSSTSTGIRPPSRTNGPRGRPTSASGTRPDMEEDAELGVMAKRKAWDTKGRLEDMEQMYVQLRSQFVSAADTKSALEENMAVYKLRVQELSQENKELSAERRNLTSDLERARNDLHATAIDLQQTKRDYERNVQDMKRKHEREFDGLHNQQEMESRRLERELEKIAEQGERETQEARRSLEKKKDEELAELTSQHWHELEELRSKHSIEAERLQARIAELEGKCESRAAESASEVQALRDQVAGLVGQLDVANGVQTSLKSQVSAAEARTAALEQEKLTLISKAHFLEGNQEAQSLEFTSMSQKLQDANDARNDALDRLRKEEGLRRKLNATILELRGNIRVFTRIRPLLSGEDDLAKVDLPDAGDLDGGKELVVHAPTTLSATGKERNEKHSYAFDRVFGPGTANLQVFDECRELIQSVVDGYNVSIMSYGQTGSGKTFGMSGPEGIIPCSIAMLLSEMRRLKEKGWEYQVEASFVEVYNETLNDLLGDAKTWDDAEDLNASVRPGGKRREKHEIHHDPVTGKTTVSNLAAIALWPPPENDSSWPPSAPTADADGSSSYTEHAVRNLLDTAAKNRRVAATKANERSSRSHSVFMLTLRGHCAATAETSEGVLNLVDLAGSERLKQSGAEGDRKRETQAINKSLSSLGDVIASLGNRKPGAGGDETHVPYRNSKLTYLLQSSLGGTTAAGKSSRTLMLLHLSPLQAHWQESRSSLLFGSKVHGTHVGSAKRK